MKHLGILALPLALLIGHSTFAADKTAAPAAGSGKTRVQEKAVTARHLRGLMQGTGGAAPVLLLRVESRIENGKQMIVATATAHSGTQGGPPVSADTLDVRVSQPIQARREGVRTSSSVASGSMSAADGKLKTVVADASMKVTGSDVARVTVTVPGN